MTRSPFPSRPETPGASRSHAIRAGEAQPPAVESRGRKAWRSRPIVLAAVCAALVVITLAAFQGLQTHPFTNYDDDVYVVENTQVHKGLTSGSIAWAFTTNESANWHPVTWLSHMLDVQLFGLDAGRHHLTSLLLHILNVVLLFLLLNRMTGALWRCALAAALFAIHPLHVESVAWIAERKDVLSTLLWLLTLAAWLRYVRSPKRGLPAPLWYALALVFFALGLMAKPMLVTLPFTLLLLDWWPLGRWDGSAASRSTAGASVADSAVGPGPGGTIATGQGAGRGSKRACGLAGLVLEKAPFFAMSAASCVVTFVVQRSGGAVQRLQDFTFTERLANAVLSYATYLRKTIWPSSLAIVYPHPHIGLTAFSVIGSALLLAAITVAALWRAERAPYLAVGWLWYLGTLVPVIGLVQVGAQAMADRYTYVPLAGLFIAIVWGAAEMGKGVRALRQALTAAAVASLAVLLAVTRVQQAHWSDNEKLFEHALAVTSNNWLAQNNLGVVLFERGRLEEATVHYLEAVRIWPGFAEAHNDLGLVAVRQGRISEGIEHYEQAIRLQPEFERAHNNLGAALGRQGRTVEAIEEFNRALGIKPDFAGAHVNLGKALVGAGRIEEGIEQYRQALRIDPDFAAAHNNLGVALANTNRMPEAREHFARAVGLDPGFEEARENLRAAEQALGKSR